MLADLSSALSELSFEQYLPALLIVLFGALVARAIAGWVGRIVTGLRGERAGTNARRIALVPLFGLACVAALDYLEVDLSIFLGAAGILTLLLGVAGKSAASEIVSGLFLVSDRPFRPGDSVRIGTVEGQVLAIDWLSVKVRTWQNTVVRIPNESVIKGEVTNLTRFASTITPHDTHMRSRAPQVVVHWGLRLGKGETSSRAPVLTCVALALVLSVWETMGTGGTCP